MNTQKVVISGIVGGIVFFFLGFLIYGVILNGFADAHPGSVMGAMRANMTSEMLYMVAGNMAFGFLLAIIFGRLANITTWMGGMMAGAMIGFFMQGGFLCIGYAVTNLYSRTWMAVDTIAFTVLTSVSGGVVAWMLGMGKKA